MMGGVIIIMRHYMNRRVTPPKWVTSPTWGPPPPCKQALSDKGLGKGLLGWIRQCQLSTPLSTSTHPTPKNWVNCDLLKNSGKLPNRFFFAFFFIFSCIVLTKSSDQRHGFAIFSISKERPKRKQGEQRTKATGVYPIWQALLLQGI